MAFLTCNKAGRFTGSASDATSWTVGAPTGGWLTPNNAISAGQVTRWIAFVSSDGVATLSVGVGSDARWTKIAQDTEATSQVTQAIFFCDTTEAFAVSPSIPALVIASTASEQFSATIGAFTAAVGKVVAYITPTTSQGNSANSDPSAITNGTGASQDLSVICSRGGDGTVTPTVNPTNYTTNLGNTASSGTNGVATTAQIRNITVANSGSEDPGAYTVATEQWVCHTIALYEAAPAGVMTETNDTATSSGSPTVSGTGAGTESADSVTSSGGSTISGTSATNEASDTVSSSGFSTVTGTLSGTENQDTTAGTGSSTVVGGFSSVENPDTVFGAGSSVVLGSSDLLESADSVSSSGNSVVNGSLTTIEDVDTASGNGFTEALPTTGTGVLIEDNDVLTATGTVTQKPPTDLASLSFNVGRQLFPRF